MNFGQLDRLRALRARLGQAGGAVPAASAPRPAAAGSATALDLVVTHCEPCERHGTGVLLRRVFGGGPPVAALRSRDLYPGEAALGAVQLRLSHGEASWPEVFGSALGTLGGLDIRRILCVPFYPDDVRTAVAAHDLLGAPMVTWVMDDQNIEADGIPDDLLRRLFVRSGLLLAISPELQRAYSRKFGLPFHLAPPAVGAEHLLAAPRPPDPERLARRQGLLFGNVWGQRWLDGLLEVTAGSGASLDWHSGGGTPWMKLDPERLRAAGIAVRPHLPEPELVATLRASPFVVVPTGTLEGEDSHGALARLSLPSRLPYVAATAGTPVLVVGHPDTGAARFVARHGLGVVIPYDRRAFEAAVSALCTPEAQARHRAAAAAIAPALSAAGMADWIWRSLAAGAPADQRFAPLELPE